MKTLKMIFLAILMILACGTMAFAAIDTQNFFDQTATTYWTPDEDSTYSSPYYRWYNEDWSWTHSALNVNSSAKLDISAWDVDAEDGEVDNIYAMDNGSWVLLGSLAGLNDAWGFTSFTLNSSFYDEIANGLQVRIDIDSTHNYDYWAVALAKSVLTTDGTANNEDPNPGTTVPEPTTMLLLGLGLCGLAGLRRKIQK